MRVEVMGVDGVKCERCTHRGEEVRVRNNLVAKGGDWNEKVGWGSGMEHVSDGRKHGKGGDIELLAVGGSEVEPGGTYEGQE